MSFFRLLERLWPHVDETVRTPEQIVQRMATRHKERTGEVLDLASVEDKLKAIGLTDEQAGLSGRRRIAQYYDLVPYTGTAEQNAELWERLLDDDDFWKMAHLRPH